MTKKTANEKIAARKSERYLSKISSCQTRSMTGMRLKMTMYNAMRTCHAEGTSFPYQDLLESYCIPGREGYLDDRKYYRIAGNGIIESDRTKSQAEQFLSSLAHGIGGRLVYGRSGQPMVLHDGMAITAAPIKDDTFFTEEYEEDYSVPYALYPRVINIVDGKLLIETSEGVTEWVPSEAQEAKACASR